jgi:DNA-binding beta-propeller fold protein YncE
VETTRRRRRRPRALAGLAAALAVGGALPGAALGFGPITSWGTAGTGPGQFGEAADVAVGPDFDVYVADRFNGRVHVFSPLGVFKRAFPAPESFGIEVAGDTVFVSDFSDAVHAFSTQGTFIREWGTSGSRTDPGQPRFSEPWGLDVGPDGRVYVADSINDRIVVTDRNGAYLGEMGAGMVNSPFGVAAPGGGSIWVADTGNSRVIRLDEGGTFHAFGSLGSGDGQFTTPWDAAFGPDGDLFVVDRGNNRIQRFNAGGGFLGKFGVQGGGPGQLQSPQGLTVDDAGNVYVADVGNTRIVRWGDRADLTAAVTSFAPGRLKAGETATITGRVANAGPDATRLATVRVAVPAGADPVAATATQGGCALGRPVTCAVGTIPAGAAVGVTVALRPTAAGTLASGVSVGGPTYDPDPTNDAAAASAAVDPAAVVAGPSLRVTFAKFHATWRRSRSSGTLEVTMDTPRAARARVELLRTTRPAQAWSVALGRAGQVTRRLPLARRLLPGRYTVRVREVGRPPGGRLPAGTLVTRLPAPPEGVASSAFISRGIGGRGVTRITGRIPGFIFANFRIAARPRKGGKLRVVWFWSGASGPIASKGVRPVRGFAVSPLRNSRGSLPAGRYRAELRYKGTVVATAAARLG